MKAAKPLVYSALSVTLLGALSAPAVAKPVYEIVNIDDYDLPTLLGTRTSYGKAGNTLGEVIGTSNGRRTTTDFDSDSGISDSEVTYLNVTRPIVADLFTFTANETTNWQLQFDPIIDTTPPSEVDSPNTTDSVYFGSNDSGTKVGYASGPVSTLPIPPDEDADEDDPDTWYYREFEQRAFYKVGDQDPVFLPPSITSYEGYNIGGLSQAVSINESNVAVGYGSTELTAGGKSYIDNCIENLEENPDTALPIDVCIQTGQFPVNGSIRIGYQTRAFKWQDNNGVVEPVQLEFPIDIDEDDTRLYLAQALGVNNNGVVVGRSHTYRDGDTSSLRYDAVWWTPDNKINQITFNNWDIFDSIAYDINDNGLMIGRSQRYISGYPRYKFFVLDTNEADPRIHEPLDFATTTTDLSSYPRSINNAGQVTGNIEVDYRKDTVRRRHAFLYDHRDESFEDVNNLLTCESKGFEPDGDSWKRHEVTVTDGRGDTFTYQTIIEVVEGNKILEDGTIIGTAFVSKPNYEVDEEGKVIIGDNGMPFFVLNANGDPITTLIPRIAVLKPTSSGEVCTYEDDISNPVYKRKGAALWWLLLAAPLIWWRRRS
ncbi:DUF3466 family protein [Paraferrimonas haliotis]|uniref:DUF3466 family protein n=1 Tax=Paraferrimonas haliotis TaxID=2013866 RepID=A0AA37TXD6_9GAMM|nr:DUF3466 family protein [Paraferrimonas haliotis]GLS84609.1 hypothetical protein GCM10007894_25860 [Paraferrimonas haliotis]